ncbi:hypothetical protein D3C80_1624240 [compost metagenome]
MTAEGLLVELPLELQKARAIGDAGNDLAHVVGFFRIIGNQPQQFIDGVERFVPGLGGEPW